MTFNNATFVSLGLMPGIYVWTWGTGLPNQNLTLIMGARLPEGGSIVFLCPVALCSGWRCCGANLDVKTSTMASGEAVVRGEAWESLWAWE